MLKIYGRDGCPMCAGATGWLEKEAIPYTFREIFKQPLSRDELLSLAEKSPDGIFGLYAPKGARKAGLPEDPHAFSREKILDLQIGNPDMIRYPLFDLGNRLLFGFYETTKTSLLAGLKQSTD